MSNCGCSRRIWIIQVRLPNRNGRANVNDFGAATFHCEWDSLEMRSAAHRQLTPCILAQPGATFCTTRRRNDQSHRNDVLQLQHTTRLTGVSLTDTTKPMAEPSPSD